MAMFISALWSDLTSRSVSFLVDRYQEKCTRPTAEERLNRLQRLLLRVHVIVEEAEERCITNLAMLHQLNMMRKEMYRGYYTLYSLIRCQQAHDEGNANDHQARKRIRLFGGGSSSSSSDEREQLQQVLGCLEATIEDAREIVVFLSGCPRLYRQPYSMYLVLDKCMFGRQMEMEHVISFLLQEDAPGDGSHGVLPIIGPRKVGKSTLVEHACNDERVRGHFSQILFLNGGNLKNENTVTLEDVVIKYQNPAAHGEQLLVIVELDGDRFSTRVDSESIDEGLWRRLYLPYIRHMPRGSKIIVASRSEKIVSFGTTPPLRLQFLDKEAFWYFFKVRTFGSTDATEHPKLASIAMDMATEFGGCFLNANMFSELLRSHVDAQFWSVALTIVREMKQKNLAGAYQVDIWEVTEPVYVPRVIKSSEDFVILDDYETSSADHSSSGTTKMTIQEVLIGTARPRGKFDVLACRSPIPPHFSYYFVCEVRNQPRRVGTRKKRLIGN